MFICFADSDDESTPNLREWLKSNAERQGLEPQSRNGNFTSTCPNPHCDGANSTPSGTSSDLLFQLFAKCMYIFFGS